MDEREIESLDEAIDELLSLGYLQYVEPEGCSVEVIGKALRKARGEIE